MTGTMNWLLARGRIQANCARRIVNAVEVCRDCYLASLVHIAVDCEAVRIERYFVSLVIAWIDQCQLPGVQVEKYNIPAKYERTSWSREQCDVASDVLSVVIGLKVGGDQCSRDQIARRRFLALVRNLCRRRHAQLDGRRRERITHH